MSDGGEKLHKPEELYLDDCMFALRSRRTKDEQVSGMCERVQNRRDGLTDGAICGEGPGRHD